MKFELLRITGAETADASAGPEFSHSSPVIAVSKCALSDVETDADGRAIFGNLTLAGTIASAACNQHAGEQGIIREAKLFLNDQAEPFATIDVTFTKQSEPEQSYLAPFPYRGEFNASIRDVKVAVGNNVIRVTATDPIFQAEGFVDLSINLEVLLPKTVNGEEVEEWELENLLGSTFKPGLFSTILASGGGILASYLLRVTDLDALPVIDDVELRGLRRKIGRAFDGPRYVLDETAQAPAIFNFVPNAVDEHQYAGEQLGFDGGFLKGFSAGGIRVIEGTQVAAKLAIGREFRLDPFQIALADRKVEERVTTLNFRVLVAGLAKVLVNVVTRVSQQNWETIDAIYTLDLEELMQLSLPYAEGIQLGIELLEAILQKPAYDSEEEKGYFVGRTISEIVELSMMELKNGRLAKLSLLAKLGKKKLFTDTKASTAMLAIQPLLAEIAHLCGERKIGGD